MAFSAEPQLPAGVDTAANSKTMHRRWAVPMALVAAAALVASFDPALVLALNPESMPGDLRKLFVLAEVYSHGVGVVSIITMVLVLDPSARRGAWRLLACPFVAGIVANLIKLVVARRRPRTLDNLADLSGWETFSGWMPLFSGDSGIQSFPSAHTAMACGLTVALVRMYPRGAWLFPFFAFLAGMQRIVGWAHYPSDVLVGAAIGISAGFLIARKSSAPE